jgi:hypothetical protein
MQDEAWNQRCKVFSDDIDRKLDRLEFKPLKEWLLRRLKALNDKLNSNHCWRMLGNIRTSSEHSYLANLSCCNNIQFAYALLSLTDSDYL